MTLRIAENTMSTRIVNHYTGIILLVTALQAAAADPDDAIAECARISSTGDRILCLENALRRISLPPGTDARPGGEAPVDQSETVDEPQVRADALAAVAPPNAVAAEQAGDVEQFGLSEAQKKQERPDAITVVVTRVSENAYGKMLVTTADGQVWRQTDQARARMPDVPFDAEIRSGASGSFFLRALNGGRAVRVRRDR